MASSSEEHSRKILSYWTPERMQSAQPEPSPNFDAAMSAQTILDYWTPERMASAQPEELVYGEPVEAAYDTEAVRAAGSLRIVPDSTVKTFPYQSVGKLWYTKVGPSGSRNSYASAWVANPSVVKTAAHCLEKGSEQATNIMFVPGFIPPSTRPFGTYPQIPGGKGVAWNVDPNWNPNNMQPDYDQGTITLDKDPQTGKSVDAVVPVIQTLANQQYTASSDWNAIGFPAASGGNPDGKMCERSGTFYRMSSSGGAVYKYGDLPGGTSGGPWILAGSNNKSNGIQAGNNTLPPNNIKCAVSPYFR